ncbi:glucose/arabinose dehydrogenase [Nakamurella sp. UYEF19]|uniref:PQQ-dependent sugar dehydrogenase n=1 Tax=Nakamurella sp. UYEF19 TaxID=1756392 RepID=UPI00339A1516
MSSTSPSGTATSSAPTSSAPTSSTGPARVAGVREIAGGLTTPWGLAFLPDGSALVTERDTAEVKLVTAAGRVSVVGRIDGVVPAGEGGLLGIVVPPDVATSRQVLVYYTAADDNRIAAVTWNGASLSGQRVVLTGIGKANDHNGGRMAFGSDGLLYVGTGDAGRSDAAQDVRSLNGKILRIRADGTPAPGNPFPQAPAVYSLGHRNVQGLAFDERGALWAAEFGQNTYDELNLVQAGDNDGWPAVEGLSDGAGFVNPQRVWATDDASPSGIAVAGGSVWMAALKGERLWQIPLTADGTADPIPLLAGTYGRLRTVEAAPDGSLWLITSNTDGRGDPADGDDRILRITLV